MEPVGTRLHATLRRAVLEHVSSERRRAYPPLLHVGTPGGPQSLFATGPLDQGDPDQAPLDRTPLDQAPLDRAPLDRAPLDQALRTDVVAAMLARQRTAADAPLVWLTRPGDLCLQDVDAAWLAAARGATAEAGLPLTMVVVTRRGWWDPRSGTTRTWRRLRVR